MTIATILAFLSAHQVAIFAALFALSEILGAIPGVKANGVFQAVFNAVKTLARLRGVEVPEEQPEP